MTSLDIQPTVDEVDGRSKLESIVQSRACEEGRAIVLDFGAIRTRASDRWATRRESVWAHVERAILRGAGRDTLHERLDETRYLLAFSELSGAAARSVGLNIMEGVLTHFLGSVSQEDCVIRMVDSIDGDEVALKRPSEDRSFAGPAGPQWESTDRLSARPAAPTIIYTDPPLQVRITMEEMFDLRAQAVLGRRIATSVYDETRRRVLSQQEILSLQTHRLLAVKTAVLDAAGERLRSSPSPVIMVPLLLQNFASSTVRFAIMEKIHRQAKDHRARLIFELTGIDGGTPVSRVQEVLSILRPVCRAVICRARPTQSAIDMIREAGSKGLAIGAEDISADPERLPAGLTAFGAAVKTATPLRMITGLEDRSQLAACTLAGYTHACVVER